MKLITNKLLKKKYRPRVKVKNNGNSKKENNKKITVKKISLQPVQN